MSKDVARTIYAEAGLVDDENARTAVARWAAASERKERRRAMVELAAVELGIPIHQDELDQDPNLLNVANGTMNLRTGEFRSHSPSDLITKLCPVALDLDQDCPLWRKTLERVIPDDEIREYFQRFCGYCLTGRVREQMMLIAYGDGANGKSTVFRTIQYVMSTSYAIQFATELLTQKSQRGHPTELADLRGARLAVGTETGQDQELDEPLLKLLTGGDRIRARRMREDFSEFSPTHKLVLITNHLPRVRGADYAMWRRLHVLAFEVKIPVGERDPQLMEKLAAERAGILAWMIKGAREWYRIGLCPPADVLRNQIESQKSVEARFVDSALCQRLGHRLPKRQILDAFASVTGNNADAVMSRVLGRALGDAGYGSKKTGGVIVYLDIDFVSDSAPGSDGSGTLTLGTLVGVEPLEISHEGKNLKQGPYGPQGPWRAR
ncbi:MAG: hypothetical protein IPK60_20860 [Sandaracinaceae bacterium]|nr:hypothetical protein [Sandaracinaceae bacterium]